jgi:hypothetical protein
MNQFFTRQPQHRFPLHIAAIALFVVLSIAAPGIETGRVDLGNDGVYDGTVWIARSTTGSVIFRDQVVGTTVSLSDLLSGQNDHGALTGLADDDHAQYLNTARHTGAHTAAFNSGLAVPADLGGNVTLGGHLADGDIHIQRDAAETIGGAWRFTGTPIIDWLLRFDTAPPGADAGIEFGTQIDAPRFLYLDETDRFELNRPLEGTTGTFTILNAGTVNVGTTLDGKGPGGVPAAALTNFASIDGIAAADLLDRSANEDVAGQWDFLAPVRFFDDCEMEDLTASGVLRAQALVLTTATETAEHSGLFSHLETTSDVLKVVIDRNGLSPAASRRLRLVGNLRLDSPLPGSDVYNTMAEYRTADGTLRSELRPSGTQIWYLTNGSTEIGKIAYSTPGNRVGIGFSEPDGTGRSDYKHRSGGGFIWAAHSGSSVPPTSLELTDAGRLVLHRAGLQLPADSKVEIPDGTTTAPFALNLHAPEALDSALTNNESLTLGGVWTGASSATLYFRWPVPDRFLGAQVVIDRCTIYYTNVDANDSIQSIRLVGFDAQGNSSDEIDHTTALTGGTSHQWIDSDYTMRADRSYLLAVDVAHSGDGAWIRSFRVEYHLE